MKTRMKKNKMKTKKKQNKRIKIPPKKCEFRNCNIIIDEWDTLCKEHREFVENIRCAKLCIDAEDYFHNSGY